MHIEMEHLDGYAFAAQIRGHRQLMDTQTPIGRDSAPSPKELLLASVLGCTGMDVVGHLRKHKQQVKRFTVTGDAAPRQEHPRVFPRIDLLFKVEGDELSVPVIEEAVQLSLTKYCGVSAMVNEVSPVHYVLVVNGATVATGQAKFD